MLFGLPAYLVSRLQSVLNAAARLIYGLRRYDRVSDALVTLRWLRIPERIKFKLAVLVHRVLHGTAPGYLGPFSRSSDIQGRQHLRSASTNRLLTPRVRLQTVGARAFSVAGPTVWNDLPSDITSIDNLSVFRRRLKYFLFSQSHPDIIL